MDACHGNVYSPGCEQEGRLTLQGVWFRTHQDEKKPAHTPALRILSIPSSKNKIGRDQISNFYGDTSPLNTS